jgi:hypothetical protein
LSHVTRQTYKAYGLTFSSEIELPELRAAGGVASAAADAHIRLAPAPREAVAAGEDYGRWYRMSATQAWIEVTDIGAFLVSDGAEIVVDPKPGVDEASVRLYLLGSAFGALLIQRKLLTLHGNAVRIGDRCVICVGDAGAGKSTLAAGFMRRGFDVLADDVVPIDAAGRAIPGFPRIKLWRDAAEQLGIQTEGLSRIRPDMEKFNVPLENHLAEPVPVSWIYVLSKAPRSDFGFTPVSGAAKFTALHEHAYRMEFVQGMRRQAEYLRNCSALAPRVSLSRVVRPDAGFDVDGLIDRLLSDMQSTGPQRRDEQR